MSTNESGFRRQPQQQRSQDRLEQILQAAAEVFWEKGYDVATTHDIAERAQTSVGTLYRFFPNKLAIFHVLEKRHKQSLDVITPQLIGPDAVQLSLADIIRRIVETYAKYFEDLAPRIVYIQYYLTPNIFLYFDESFDRGMIDGFAALLKSRNPALTPEKSKLLSEVFLRTYQALLLVALRSGDARRHQIQLEIQDVLINYLAPYSGDGIRVDSPDGQSLLPRSIQPQTQAQVQVLTKKHSLNPRQQAAIAHVLMYGSLTTQTFEILCPKPSRRTLQRDLKQLVVNGLLQSEGSTNQLIYQMANSEPN